MAYRSIPPFALAAALIVAAAAPGRSETTLSQAVDAVLRRNPGLAAAGAARDAARASRRAADRMGFPSLRARASFTRGDDPVFAFGSLLRQQAFGPGNFAVDKLNNPADLTDLSGAIELGVPLFTAFELGTARAMGRIGEREAEALQSSAAQGARLGALEAYLQALWRAAAVRMLDERIRDSRSEIASADRLKEKGQVLGSDYEAARALLAALRLRRARERTALDAAKETLALMMGVEPGEIVIPDAVADSTAGASAAAAGGGGPLARPDLALAGLRVEAARSASLKERSSLLPRLSAFGAVETHSRNLGVSPSTRMFGVRAVLPFGDASYAARTLAAEARVEAGRKAAEQARESAQIEILAARKALQGALEGLPIATEMAARARESLRRFLPLYRQGRQSILEVLRAQSGLADAEGARLALLYGARAQTARLLHARGSLDDEAVRAIERDLTGGSR